MHGHAGGTLWHCLQIPVATDQENTQKRQNTKDKTKKLFQCRSKSVLSISVQMVKTITSIREIPQDTNVILDFYADWCGPCRVLSPEVQKAAKLLGNSAKVLKINVDKNPAVSQAYKIQSIPTLMIFKNGQLLWRKAGTMSAHQISETVKKFI